MEIYVDNNVNKSFEDGTQRFPYSNIAFAFQDIFNFRISTVNMRILLSEGEHIVYSGILPLFAMYSTITVTPVTQC